MIWIVLFGVLLAVAVVVLVFLIRNVRQLRFVAVLSRGNRAASCAIGTAVTLLPLVLIGLLWGYVNAVIVMLHLAIFLALAKFVLFIVRKVSRRNIRRLWAGVTALAVTVLYLGVGWVQAHHVRQTNYSIDSDKNVGSIRIALLADSHIGTTFDGNGIAEYINRINRQKPDVVVIAGDFVDEDTEKTDMQNACRALKDLHAPFGVYFVFGNHDKGKYSNGARGYSGDDLISELQKNAVTVLQDENVLIDDRFYLIGRQDASEERDFGGKRAAISELTEGLDKSKFSVVLDHQPHDYKAEAAAGADLVLSGHTHGGQMIPLVQLIRLFHLGGDDNVYGAERRADTDFIVTSGISDWAVKFKTGCRSEFVIIDINGK